MKALLFTFGNKLADWFVLAFVVTALAVLSVIEPWDDKKDGDQH